MGDLLKNMRSSQIFSVCGLPEVRLSKVKNEKKVNYASKAETHYQVELLGLDVFDPISMEVDHQSGNDVPAWFLDTDYNSLCFHVSQAFFPRTGAWENLKKALKGDYEESVWDHLAGTISQGSNRLDRWAGPRSQIARNQLLRGFVRHTLLSRSRRPADQSPISMGRQRLQPDGRDCHRRR